MITFSGYWGETTTDDEMKRSHLVFIFRSLFFTPVKQLGVSGRKVKKSWKEDLHLSAYSLGFSCVDHSSEEQWEQRSHRGHRDSWEGASSSLSSHKPTGDVINTPLVTSHRAHLQSCVFFATHFLKSGTSCRTFWTSDIWQAGDTEYSQFCKTWIQT